MKYRQQKKGVSFDCRTCRDSSVSLVKSLSQQSPEVLKSLVLDQGVLEKSDMLFKQGQAVDGLYVLRSGSFKYVYNDPRKNQPKVLEFFLSGDIMGLDSLHLSKYSGTLIALECSSVCRISHKKLLSVLPSTPSLLHDLVTTMSQMNERVVWRTYESLNAQERILTLMQRFSKHAQDSGQSGSSFSFPVSKQDMANYLGLTQETVSRQLASLRKQNILNIQQKQVEFDYEVIA